MIIIINYNFFFFFDVVSRLNKNSININIMGNAHDNIIYV